MSGVHPAIAAVGTDIMRIATVEASLDRFGDRYRRRVFVLDEVRLCEAGSGRGAGYAARFAGKEAVIKVLGTTDVTYTEVEIAGAVAGRVDVRLHGRAAAHAARAGIDTIVLWLGYWSDYAVAAAIGFPAAPGRDGRRYG